MIIKLALFGGDSNYAQRLIDFCCEEYADKLEVSCYSMQALSEQDMDLSRFDIVLVQEKTQWSHERLPEGTVMAWLTSEVYQEIEGLPAICAYQPMEQFYRELLALYSQHTGRDLKIPLQDKTYARIYAVIGASGGCGSSSVAAGLALHLISRSQRVTYLNLEHLGEVALYFRAQGKETFSDLLYALKSNRANLPLRMESILRRDSRGVRFYASPANPLERQEMTGEDAGRLLEELRQSPEHDAIVIDLPKNLDEIFWQILSMADRILVVCDGSNTAQCKLNRLLLALETSKGRDLFSRCILLGNRGGLPQATSNLPVGGVFPTYATTEEGHIIQAMSVHPLFTGV